jgi:mitochondrial import receptor subunit TOM40
MQANLDSDKSLLARFNYRWNSGLVTRTTTQIAPGQGAAVGVLENEYQGSDFVASVKANNPSILEGGLTGTVSGDYMQSITPRLSLGLNAAWQREAMNKGPDMFLTYMARYKGNDWIGSARFMSMMGIVQLSYWRRIAEKIEAGVNLEVAMAGNPQAAMMGMPSGPEGQATIGAKYDFRNSSFRAQVDSNGRIACMLEKRVAPPVQVTFVGQIDHIKVGSNIPWHLSLETDKHRTTPSSV